MVPRTVAAVLACCALAPAAQASSRPNFPKVVTGTVSGSYVSKKDGLTDKATWTIKGLRLKLVHVRFVENTWTGFYDVTAGTVTFTDNQTGSCSYSLNQTFALKPVLPSRKLTTPFSMTRNMLGKDSYGADMRPTKRWNVTETCSYEGSEPTTQTRKVTTGNLLDTGTTRFRIGRAMKGRYSYADDYEHSTTVFKWSLKPR